MGLVSTIGIAVIAAAVLVVIFSRLKQPALLAFIVAGLLLGFFARPMISGSIHIMEDVSHLGLVFLLFIIGLEMNLKGILQLGPRVAAALLLQAPMAIAFILGLQWLFDTVGWQIPGLAHGKAGWFYFAVATSLGSTAVVVRLLGEKFDLDSQAGKTTVLTLIAQDIWAVLALSYVLSQTSGEKTGGVEALFIFGSAAVLAVLLILVAKYVVSRIMTYLAKAPDLIALVAIGWCFTCASALAWVGLSAEMGALIAGLSLGSLAVATEVLAKVSSLRDFFMALFFVSLGMSLPPPDASIIISAAALVLFTILTRALLFLPSLIAARLGPIVSLTTVINLSQLSEFTLLIVPIGYASGALSIEETSTISYALMLSVLLSSYSIKNNYRLAAYIASRLGLKGRTTREKRSVAGVEGDQKGYEHGAEIIMLGYFLNTEALIRRLKAETPDLLSKILVIDYNLQNHPQIAAHGVRIAYGDISNPDTLRHFGIEKAKVAISTISDTFLRGTSNEKLLKWLKLINPNIVFIGTSDKNELAEDMVKHGAFACVCPPEEAAPKFIEYTRKALEKWKHSTLEES